MGYFLFIAAVILSGWVGSVIAYALRSIRIHSGMRDATENMTSQE